MNTANMTALANLLDTINPAKFDMTNWVSWMGGVEMKRTDFHNVGECGTTACIAGWAFVLQYPSKEARVNALHVEGRWLDDEAQAWLDLTGPECDHLFTGQWSNKRDRKFGYVGIGTPQEAAAAVRAMIAAGGIPGREPEPDDDDDDDDVENLVLDDDWFEDDDRFQN